MGTVVSTAAVVGPIAAGGRIKVVSYKNNIIIAYHIAGNFEQCKMFT